MNDYLVQYASVDSMVHEWTKADSHIDAAANVLIDKGFDNLMWKNDDSIIVVVCKNEPRHAPPTRGGKLSSFILRKYPHWTRHAKGFCI